MTENEKESLDLGISDLSSEQMDLIKKAATEAGLSIVVPQGAGDEIMKIVSSTGEVLGEVFRKGGTVHVAGASVAMAIIILVNTALGNPLGGTSPAGGAADDEQRDHQALVESDVDDNSDVDDSAVETASLFESTVELLKAYCATASGAECEGPGVVRTLVSRQVADGMLAGSRKLELAADAQAPGTQLHLQGAHIAFPMPDASANLADMTVSYLKTVERLLADGSFGKTATKKYELIERSHADMAELEKTKKGSVRNSAARSSSLQGDNRRGESFQDRDWIDSLLLPFSIPMGSTMHLFIDVQKPIQTQSNEEVGIMAPAISIGIRF